MIRGLITAIVTPMGMDGAIDFDSLEKLVEYQIINGAKGIVVLGSTGEAATLSESERFAVIHRVIDCNARRIKIIVGVSYANTAEAIEYIEKLNQINGIDYVMVVTPYYLKPTQDGLYKHFVAVADVSARPVIMYNVPGRTGCDLKDDTALSLANDISNIVGLKDATGNIGRAGYLVANKPDNFRLFSGDDATAMGFMLCGGDGVISVLGNLFPRQMSELALYALAGNKAGAIGINSNLVELYDLMGIESNPIPVKWALFYKGIIEHPTLRLPLTTLMQLHHDKLSKAIDIL